MRVVIVGKRWQKHMRKVMKRFDQSRKEINFESSHIRELEKLQELQRQGRLASQWLNERFGERGEGYRRIIQDEGSLKEMDERVRINTTNEEEYSAKTREEFVGESKPVTPEDVGLHHQINTSLQMNKIP
jgi:hypothetical protein